MRAELLGQLVAAQFSLDAVIAELERSGAPVDAARNQLQALTDTLRMVGAASPAALAQMRAEIVATVGAANMVAQQSRNAASRDTPDDLLAATSANTRAAVQRISADLFERKIFDRDLLFASEEDERAYRQREAEREARVREELAKGTPEGNLNAAAGTIGQMVDAGAHGADRNPQFQQQFDELIGSTQRLRDQMIRNGQDVSEFDRHLREDLRQTMRAKGIPDERIDALLAAHPNPVDAAAAFVAENRATLTERDMDELGGMATTREANSTANAVSLRTTEQPATPAGLVSDSLAGAVADLKALGIVVADHETDPAHGVTANIAASPQRGNTLS